MKTPKELAKECFSEIWEQLWEDKSNSGEPASDMVLRITEKYIHMAQAEQRNEIEEKMSAAFREHYDDCCSCHVSAPCVYCTWDPVEMIFG